MNDQFPDLRTFIDRLRRDDDFVSVDVPVDPHLEVAEIHRRVIAAGDRRVHAAALEMLSNH